MWSFVNKIPTLHDRPSKKINENRQGIPLTKCCVFSRKIIESRTPKILNILNCWVQKFYNVPPFSFNTLGIILDLRYTKDHWTTMLWTQNLNESACQRNLFSTTVWCFCSVCLFGLLRRATRTSAQQIIWTCGPPMYFFLLCDKVRLIVEVVGQFVAICIFSATSVHTISVFINRPVNCWSQTCFGMPSNLREDSNYDELKWQMWKTKQLHEGERDTGPILIHCMWGALQMSWQKVDRSPGRFLSIQYL